MNVIDALVVTLGLNDAEFQAKLEKSFKSLSSFANKEAAIEKKRDRDSGEQKRKASETERKQHLERERQVKAATEGYQKLSGAIVGMVGAIAGMAGVKALITGSINNLINVGRASQDLRMSASNVAAWGKTIESVGGKSEDMIATMRGMSLAVANASEGFNVDNPFVTFLNNQGIQWKKADGSLRNMGEMLPEIADAFKKFRPEQQAIIAQQNGWNDDFVALLRKGSAEIKRIQAEKLAQTQIDEASIKRAEKMQEAWAGIKSRLQAVGMAIFEKLLPHIEKAVGYLEQFSGWVNSNSDRIAMFFSGIGDILGAVVDWLKEMHVQTGGWSTKIMAAAAAFMAFKGVLGGILSMTGLPMLMKLLGGAGGGLGLAGLAKLGAVGAAGAAGWGIGSLINKHFVEGTSFGDWIGRAGARVMGNLGNREAQEAANAEAKAKGWVLPYPELEAIQKTGKTQAATANSQLEEAKKGNKAAAQTGNEQTGYLKKIEQGIAKMSAAFEAGYNGMSQPADGGIAGGVAYSAGTLTGAIVNSAFGQIMKKAEGDYGVVNTGKRHGYKAARVNLEGMTVAQVMAAQARGDFNAAGRYQIIGLTMRGAAKTLGLSGNEMFDKSMQDRIFVEYLLKRKRKAVWNYIHGKSDNLHGAMLAVSQEWASFAAPAGAKTRRGLISDGNMSFYAGNGVDKASVSAAQSAAMLQQLRAQVMSSGSTNNRSEVHIGQVNIQTAATDANGIAREIRPAVNRSMAGVTALGMI